ncbi:homoserine kinase [bacterium]|nr:homoserine kinase [bacterium]
MVSNTRLLIRVPASTSNLGPGFDCVGLALSLYNDFTVRPLTDGPNRIEGRGTCVGLNGDGNFFFKTMERVAKRAGGLELPAVEVVIDGNVPLGSGLGSSATACVAGALAANYYLGSPLAIESLVEVLIEAEGHPDNVTPALLGGLTVTAIDADGPLVHVYEPAPSWRYVVIVPDYSLSTKKMRTLLPSKVTLQDAVYNIGRVPLVLDSLIGGDAQMLRRALGDRLHEDARASQIKRYRRMKRAALEAGAATVFVSGSGPTVAAVCHEDRANSVLDAMMQETIGASFTVQGFILEADMQGTKFAEME